MVFVSSLKLGISEDFVSASDSEKTHRKNLTNSFNQHRKKTIEEKCEHAKARLDIKPRRGLVCYDRETTYIHNSSSITGN